jgi:hypothetical protein
MLLNGKPCIQRRNAFQCKATVANGAALLSSFNRIRFLLQRCQQDRYCTLDLFLSESFHVISHDRATLLREVPTLPPFQLPLNPT